MHVSVHRGVTQQVKEKRVARAHVHEARAERIIEFYAAARKITLCIAFPPCTSHLEHEIHLSRDLTETGQISSYSSTRLSFKRMFAESEASNLCLPLSQMSSQTTSLGQEYMVDVT